MPMTNATQDLKPYMTITTNDGTTFRWHGGEYIDVGSMWHVDGQPGVDGDDFHAYDVINVWDYETGQPSIARTLGAFEVRVREYLCAEVES